MTPFQTYYIISVNDIEITGHVLCARSCIIRFCVSRTSGLLINNIGIKYYLTTKRIIYVSLHHISYTKFTIHIYAYAKKKERIIT